MTLPQLDFAIGAVKAEELFNEMMVGSGRRVPHDIHVYRTMFLLHVAPLPRSAVTDVQDYVQEAGDLLSRGEIIEMCTNITDRIQREQAGDV